MDMYLSQQITSRIWVFPFTAFASRNLQVVLSPKKMNVSHPLLFMLYKTLKLKSDPSNSEYVSRLLYQVPKNG